MVRLIDAAIRRHLISVTQETESLALTDPSETADLFEPGRYTRLDPRSLKLEYYRSIISTVVIGVICTAGTLVLTTLFPWTLWLNVAIAVCVLVACVWGIVVYDRRAFAVAGYRLDDRILAIRGGVWWKRVRLVPLTRVQHVDISVGPIQRKFGLATLQLHTAAAGMSAIELPGLSLETAEQMRDLLLARLEPAKTSVTPPPLPALEPQEPVATDPAGVSDRRPENEAGAP